ncbi:MAG: BMP family ABC transporter substrate-binding protein [Tabrizicola sp.]|uniref:BMP family ABC transporter substrate-binding protein n=1 Tax=Tabrizicola sp. TaxID=2005166 RepID=UPI0027350762|nr:BMP family ABC transporter substrate-binding protein [Tabrizicola sp.]MDP3262591.1 BMP family ABC transporter substrate-binding protein [Tabrizicola sp.]MDP3647751.1 BMP family ABC transporter substrate-binding protein [Paracoccaceae bacterium]MDZ4068155.1 BMP family ABC transporter substrate-binding protein [Tabrizicola sp.]
MKRRTLLATAALGLSVAFAGTAMAQDKTKACFVYVGPIGDGGWTYQHHQGALAVQAEYGDKVEVQWQENVPEGADAERVLTQMALGGCNIIFTTSFGYMDATNAVAAKFPDVKFEHATGYKRDSANVSTYNARFYEGRAVQGHIAGRMTKSNKIGYIASFPIPEVIMGINSYYLHAKKVNPNVELSVIWAYTWFDPAKEADAAKALIEQGVDVIASHTDSTAPLAEAAKTPGVIGFGQASDMAAYKPSPRVSSIIDNWAPYYVKRVGALMDGTYEQADAWEGIAGGEVEIGEITDAVPADVKAEAEAMRDAIAAGTYHPFTGPIKKQDGSDWLADGVTAPDGDLLGMAFYVEGITGDIPK